MLKPLPALISVVIPCRNEEANVQQIAVAVIVELEKIGSDFELIFIDNSSSDQTVPLIRNMCAADRRIRLILNTRNFGQMRSPTHAIFQASGDVIISLCADFEDPPQLIPSFVAKWREGAEIVLGVSRTRNASRMFSAIRKFSYAMQRIISDTPIVPNATGFGLYDARVVRRIAQLNEPEPFFRGLLVETGFSIATIPFDRPPRAAGRSNNGFWALLDFALSGLAVSSKNLLRVPLYVSFFAFCATAITFLGGCYSIIVGANPRMWLFATLIELQFGLLFMFLGLVGVQVRLISDRTRGFPLVIERERVNFEPAQDR